MIWKPPAPYRLSPVLTPTPEAIVVEDGVGMLAEAPADPASYPIIVIVGGSTFARVASNPSASQYAIDTSDGQHLPRLLFNAADNGKTGTVAYYRVGTIITAEFWKALATFIRPLTGYASPASFPAPTTDPNTRGYPGDVAFLTTGAVYTSTGTAWLNLGV